jgi:hypothetical protein
LSPKKSFQDGEALAKSFVLKKLDPKVEGSRGPSPTNQRVPEGSTRSKRTRQKIKTVFFPRRALPGHPVTGHELKKSFQY